MKKKSLLRKPDLYIRHFKDSFGNRNLASKFNILYIFIISFFMLCNIIILHIFYNYTAQNTITALAMQNLDAIYQNVDTSLHSISKISGYTMGNSVIQNYTSEGSQTDYSALMNKQLRTTLYLALESMPLATSIFFIGENGHYEAAARYNLPKMNMTYPCETNWYEKVKSLHGSPLYTVNADNCLDFSDGERYLSMIRLINNTESAKPVGYMIINIPLSSLFTFSKSTKENYSDICVMSSNYMILNFSDDILRSHFSTALPGQIPAYQSLLLDGKRYLILKHYNASLDWYYFSATRYTSYFKEYIPFLLIFFFTMLSCMIAFLLIAFTTKHFITKPVYNLNLAMKRTEQGNLKPVHLTKYNDEIGSLQQSYNEMISQIHSLLEAKIKEQKLLRKFELNIMQEQIKPHFLYNSLNGIAYLIKSNQNNTAYDLIISLSEYYRESLSKGSEFIPLKTEIHIVQNYLKLQKMRFQDIFEDIYEVEENALSLLIPKLVIQPLVENSLYHGILPTGGYGIIRIRAYIKAEHLMLHIFDDGIGMNETKLQSVLKSNIDNNKKSFGLRKTVERLQIFYESDTVYKIISAPNQGTEIIFSLPLSATEDLTENES